MSCPYKVNDTYIKEVDAVFQYIDKTSPENRTAEDIYKILKNNKVLTKFKDQIFIIKYDKNDVPKQPYNLKVLKLLNGALRTNLFIIEQVGSRKSYYQGFIQSTYRVLINPDAVSDIVKVSDLMPTRDRLISEKVEELSKQEFKLSPEELQRQAEEYATIITDSINSSYANYSISEEVRLEQEAKSRRFSKMSEMKEETMSSTVNKIAKLKAAFRAVGIEVEVLFDDSVEGLGEVDTTGENPVIRIHPKAFREDTVYHEFGHLFVDLLGTDNPLVQQALKEIRRRSVLEEVKLNYPELTEEEAELEALVTEIGRIAAVKNNKAQSKLKTLIRKILRAIGKIFGISPDAITEIAERLFTGEIKKEDLRGTIAQDVIRQKKAQKKAEKEADEKISDLDNLVAKIKADTYLKKREAQDRLDQRRRQSGKVDPKSLADTKDLARLKALQAKLNKVEKVEDLLEFVRQAIVQAGVAETTFAIVATRQPALGEKLTQEAALRQINMLMEAKRYLDSFWDKDPKKSLLTQIQSKAGRKQRALAAKDKKSGGIKTLQTHLDIAIAKMTKLNDDFERFGLPLLAEYLYNFHNTAIDDQIKDIIKNLETHGRSAYIDTSDPVYLDIKDRKKDMSPEAYEKELSRFAISQLKSKLPTKQTLIRDLKSAHRDKSWFSHYFDPAIYSSSVPLQLMMVAIKSKYLNANESTRQESFILNKAYDKFQAATGKSDYNSAEFNRGLFEIETIRVREPKTDKYIDLKVKTLIQPYRASDFKKARNKFYREIDKKWGKPPYDPSSGSTYQRWLDTTSYVEWRKEEGKWYEQNTVAVSNAASYIDSINVRIAALIASKHAKKKKSDGELFAIDNEIVQLRSEKKKLTYKKADGTVGYKAKLAMPNNKWLNSKYSDMTTAQKEYYDVLLKIYKKHQNYLPSSALTKNSWDDFTYLLPTIFIDAIENGAESGVSQAFKDIIKEGTEGMMNFDIDYGVLKDINNEQLKSVPIFYTNPTDAKDVSSDIASSIMRFVHMANMYKEKSNILSVVNLSLDVMERFEAPETDARGRPLIHRLIETMGGDKRASQETITGKDTKTYKAFEEAIKQNFFGQVDIQSNIKIGGKEFEANKIARTLTSYTALNTLALNFLQAGAQGMYDNFTASQEAVAREYYSASAWAEAYTIYWGGAAAMQDLGEFTAKTKLGQWVQFFDALVEFSEEATRTRAGAKGKKVLDTSSFMFAQKFVEHSLQVRRSLALGLSEAGKLKSKNGKVILNDQGKPASLWDVFIEVKPGIYGIDPRVANFNKLQFVNRHHGLSRRTNQIKGLFDRAPIQRRAAGKLLMLYKNWVVPGFRRRFGHGDGAHVDEELGGVTEAMYLSFWRLMQKSLRQKDPRQFTEEYYKMTPHEKANVKRTLLEISGVLGTFVLIGAIGAMVPSLDDDDPHNDPYLAQYFIYQLRRFRTEVSAFYNPAEAWRMIKSPTATVRPVSNLLNMINHFVFKDMPYVVFNKGLGMDVIDEGNVFQQRDGIIEEGDPKILKYIKKSGFKGFMTAKNPKEALRFFDRPSEF